MRMRALTLVPVILLVLVARGNLCSSTKGLFRAIQACQNSKSLKHSFVTMLVNIHS
ncbi:unnamed protein product, partial [Vitis vinifera]|uniref:Uncharacterized protein n=1 Tax=Vitis vinifera TaxID=29760 RepID=D7T580_VITVI